MKVLDMNMISKIINITLLSNDVNETTEEQIQKNVLNEIQDRHTINGGSSYLINIYDILEHILNKGNISNIGNIMRTFDSVCIATNIKYIEFNMSSTLMYNYYKDKM